MEGHYGAPRHRDDTPSNAFQHVCRVMLDGTSKEDLTKQKIEDFRVILHMIMHECSKANIETGKSWVFEYCHNPVHTCALMEYILSLARTKSSQQEKVHLVYLVNDILFHSSRKQILWMKDSMLPMLVPLLRLAYEADSEEYKAKMIKMISFWGEKNIFDGNVISNIRQAVIQPVVDSSQQSFQSQSSPLHPPPPPPPPFPISQIPVGQSFPPPIPQQQQQQQQQVYHQPFPQPPFPQQHHQQQQQQPLQQYQQPQPQRQQPLPQHPPPPPRPYFELPAGLMTLVKCEDYQALDPNSIKLPFPKPNPSQTILDALDDFYNGLDLTSPSEDQILSEKPESTKIDSQGWEKGYLDFHFQLIQQKKKDKLEKRNLENRRRNNSSHHRSSDRRSYSREERYGRRGGHHRSRSSYSRSRSRSPSYRRRRSFSSSRSRSRSRGRSRSPRSRGHSSRSGGGGRSPRGRSSPRDRSPRGRSPRGRSPRGRSPPTQRGSYRYQRHYSRSRSPVYSQSSSSTSSMKKPSFRNSMAQAPPPPVQAPLKRLVNAPVADFTVENKYLGLGNTMDEYDSFRRNKSQAFNRREPPQPITCFKCNRVGHLARDCDSL